MKFKSQLLTMEKELKKQNLIKSLSPTLKKKATLQDNMVEQDLD